MGNESAAINDIALKNKEVNEVDSNEPDQKEQETTDSKEDTYNEEEMFEKDTELAVNSKRITRNAAKNQSFEENVGDISLVSVKQSTRNEAKKQLIEENVGDTSFVCLKQST